MAKRVGDGATITFATNNIVLELTSIGWDGVSRETTDSSTLATTLYKEFIVNKLIDPGELQLEGAFDGTLTATVEAALANVASQAVVIAFGDNTNITFNCCVTAFSVKVGLGELNTFSLTAKATSTITWDYNAAA